MTRSPDAPDPATRKRVWDFKRVIDLAGSVLLGIASVMLITRLVQDWMQPPPTPSAAMVDVTGETIASTHLSNVKGDGPVAVIEFSDFECPACQMYHNEQFSRIHASLVDSGDIRYIAMHFPLDNIHLRARDAAIAAECAGRQQHFWPMHSALFAAAPDLSPARLRLEAGTLGIDTGVFNDCLTGEGPDKVASDVAEGRRIGVTGTPTFFVGRVLGDGSVALSAKIVGASTAADIRSIMAQMR